MSHRYKNCNCTVTLTILGKKKTKTIDSYLINFLWIFIVTIIVFVGVATPFRRTFFRVPILVPVTQADIALASASVIFARLGGRLTGPLGVESIPTFGRHHVSISKWYCWCLYDTGSVLYHLLVDFLNFVVLFLFIILYDCWPMRDKI